MKWTLKDVSWLSGDFHYPDDSFRWEVEDYYVSIHRIGAKAKDTDMLNPPDSVCLLVTAWCSCVCTRATTFPRLSKIVGKSSESRWASC